MDLKEIVEQYHQQLLVSDAALEYLQNRNISQFLAKSFKLGWIEEPLKDEHTPHVGRCVVPYLAVGGNVNALRESAFEWDATEAYERGWFDTEYPFPNSPYHIFSAGHAMPGMRTNHVVIVSDVYSAIMMRESGLRVVAIPGWRNWREAWVELFVDAKVTFIHNGSDLEFANRITDSMRKRGVPVEAVWLPENHTMSMYFNGTIDSYNSAVATHYAPFVKGE